MCNNYSKVTLAMSLALAMNHTHVLAQEASSLFGRVVSENNQTVFSNAKIDIPSLNRSALSRSDGTFRFSNLPVGEYTLHISYVGLKEITQKIQVESGENILGNIAIATGTNIEELIVRGQRSGEASAINRQRNANNIVSVVSADAIGDFPDQNAAESLQRLPGVSIERDQGEGRFVGIRGIDPNLNSVSINGLSIPSPESGVRSVALDVIPSELIQTLEVSKSSSADQDADSIGGSISIKSISAFDRTEDTTILVGQLSYNDLRDKLSPKTSVTITRQLSDTFGVAAAISYLNRDFGSDNIESNGEDEVEQRSYTITRERLGGALNLDYRPNYNDEYYLRTLYSKFSDDEVRLANIFTEDGEDSEIERETRDRKETQTILTFALGGENQQGDWTFDYQAGYAKSDEDEPSALSYLFTQENGSVDLNLAQQIPSISVNALANDLNEYELDEVSFENNQTEDIETSLKANVIRSFNPINGLSSIKSGFKIRLREKEVRANVSEFGGGFDGINVNSFASPEPDYGLGSFGPGLDASLLRQDFAQNGSTYELDELESELESIGASYVSTEDIYAAYLLGEWNWDKLRVNAGLRYEYTDFSTTGSIVDLVEDEQNDIEQVVASPFNSDSDYDHLLFSLNARYEISEKVVLRGAFSQTISRPIFEQSAAFQIIESTTEEEDDVFIAEREAEIGNPSLEALESDNFDISVEYYPGSIGVLSAGVFYKKIDNFIIFADVAGTEGFESFEEVIQPLNGESADLTGLELSWVKTFENGFLISANGTFSNSDAVTLLDGERFETSLPNQSDQIGNLTFGYEDNAWSLRLTMTYKSDNLEEIDGELLRIEDDHQQIDFSGKYFINEDLNLYFNAININDEPLYNFFDEPNQNAQFEEYGRTFEIGVRWQL